MSTPMYCPTDGSELVEHRTDENGIEFKLPCLGCGVEWARTTLPIVNLPLVAPAEYMRAAYTLQESALGEQVTELGMAAVEIIDHDRKEQTEP